MRVDLQVDDSAALHSLRLKAAALRDLRPVLKDIAGEVDRLTALTFTESRSVDMWPFAELAESTKIGRLRARKSVWKKVMGSKGAKKKRGEALRGALRAGQYSEWERMRREQRAKLDALLASTKFTPLVNTGRGRNSIRALVTTGGRIQITAVKYMMPHVTGGKRRAGDSSRSIYTRMASRLMPAVGGHPPQRNWSVFRVVGSRLVLAPLVSQYITARLARALATQRGTA